MVAEAKENIFKILIDSIIWNFLFMLLCEKKK